MELWLNRTLKRLRISSPTMVAVHSAKGNLSCSGFLLDTVSYTHFSLRASSFGGRPPRLCASSRPHPPLRYSASQRNRVRTFTPKALATAAGLCPCCTHAIARLRSSVSVLWSSFRASVFIARVYQTTFVMAPILGRLINLADLLSCNHCIPYARRNISDLGKA